LKHAKAWGPSVLRRVRIQEKTKIGEYLVADSVPAVVALAQMGVVEIHTWNTIAGDVERPDRIVWDLDPGPDVTWTETVAAARLLRELLQTLGLRAWVKTSGGRGLHVIVPIRPSSDWSECLSYSRAVADAMVRIDSSRYTIRFAKQGREGQVLVDYLRNNRTNTTISAYSPRARAGAPVSMPLDWTELSRRPTRWTLLTAPRRLRRLDGDPWSDYWTTSQRITKSSVRTLQRI
jgi:bifunctional non-homologous end joining protein LigD